MNLTEEQLRERGILRSVEEMVSEAEKMVALSVASMPVGRRVADSAREFTESESEALHRGGLDVSRASGGNQLALTAARYAAMLASSLTVAEAAALVGVSESRIRQRMGDRTLYSVRVGKERRLPRFQFAEGEEVPGVGEVLREIPEDIYTLSIENWFTHPNPDLYLDKDEEEPVSPREWLLSGGSPGVLVPVAKEL